MAVDMSSRFPLPTLFLFTSLFFERCTFYGIRTLLPLFLKNALDMTEQTSTVVYHMFFVCCYFTPLVGAVIADSFIGNYSTIIWFTIVFITGGGLLTATAVPILELPSKNIIVYLSLGLIALGSGGIKPCLSSLGGDQFNTPALILKLSLFFSIFNWVSNAAYLLSVFVTPIMRSDIHCFGESSCFSLLFLIGFGFLIFSLVFILFGKKYFYLKKRDGNILLKVSKCIGYSLGQWVKSGNKKLHWLDHSITTHGEKMVEDVKIVLRVLLLYVPLPIFWALLDQQGSRWTFQAERMSGEIFNIYTIKPDQFQVINRLLILLFIPLFDHVIYPLFAKCNLLKNPLHRMLIGGILAALAFIASGIVENALENNEAVKIHMMWQLPQYFMMTTAEVMFQITGMEFAYSQVIFNRLYVVAPSTMKSIMSAMWLLTSAVGNLLVAVVAQFNIFQKMSEEFFLFAGIMLIDMVIFGIIARKYNNSTLNLYSKPNADKNFENCIDNINDNSSGIDNKSFEESQEPLQKTI